MASNVNPANVPEVKKERRIPMSVPVRALEVPELPGYHLHWFLDRNVSRAVQAGYEFVESDELAVANRGVANDREESGNTSLGSRISVIGSVDERGDPERLNLMKIREEWYQEDQKTLADRNENIAKTLRSGMIGAEQDDAPNVRYLKSGGSLFFPKTQR